MSKIENIDTAYYRVKLPQVLTDSTHGEMAYFELVTVRITDSEGIQGVGYTYAVNHGGASIHAMINRDLSDHLIGKDPSRIEALWEKMWWAVHYPGRGGIALGEQHHEGAIAQTIQFRIRHSHGSPYPVRGLCAMGGGPCGYPGPWPRQTGPQISRDGPRHGGHLPGAA